MLSTSVFAVSQLKLHWGDVCNLGPAVTKSMTSAPSSADSRTSSSFLLRKPVLVLSILIVPYLSLSNPSSISDLPCGMLFVNLHTDCAVLACTACALWCMREVLGFMPCTELSYRLCVLVGG